MSKARLTICFAAVILTSSVSTAGVDFHLSSPSAGLVTIGYTAQANTGIRGVALNVQLSDNATAVFSDIVSTYPAFNTFIDYSFSNSGYTIGVINPPLSFFTISMGVLGEPAPAVVPNLITFRIQDGGAGFSTVTISPDTLRGGVVGDNIGTVTMPPPLLVAIPEPGMMLLLGLGGIIARRGRRS